MTATPRARVFGYVAVSLRAEDRKERTVPLVAFHGEGEKGSIGDDSREIRRRIDARWPLNRLITRKNAEDAAEPRGSLIWNAVRRGVRHGSGGGWGRMGSETRPRY